VFVDDGSTDRSPELLRAFAQEDPRLRVVRFARNFGQQMANTAGLRYARGEAVVLMDADLQMPAENIPLLLDKLREGYDIVYGVREKIDQPLYRRIGTVAANILIHRLTGFAIPDGASGFLALHARLVHDLNRYPERSRYISGLLAYLSYGRYATVPVTRRARKYGETKYSALQLVRLVFNLITGFSTRPLNMAFGAGLAVMGLGGVMAVVWAIEWVLMGWAAARLTLLTAVMLAVGGLQIFFVGILGEYVGRTYNEVRQRPPYVIAELLNIDDPPHAEPAANPHAATG